MQVSSADGPTALRGVREGYRATKEGEQESYVDVQGQEQGRQSPRRCCSTYGNSSGSISSHAIMVDHNHPYTWGRGIGGTSTEVR